MNQISSHGDKSSEARREARIARLQAQRGTPEAAERTAAHEAAKAAAAQAAADRAAANRRQNIIAAVEQAAARVDGAKLERAIATINRMIDDATADFPETNPDDIAHDMIESFVQQLPPTRANLGLAAEVCRTQLGFTAAETARMLGIR